MLWNESEKEYVFIWSMETDDLLSNAGGAKRRLLHDRWSLYCRHMDIACVRFVILAISMSSIDQSLQNTPRYLSDM